ncbi:hypothetical protein Tco_1446569 [Tanacetum coccineum]
MQGVSIAREIGEKGENHSSLCVLAMKAWLGLGRYGGTEKDMKLEQWNCPLLGSFYADCVVAQSFKYIKICVKVAKKTAQKSKTLSTDIEGWEKADVLLDKAGNNG